MRKIAYFGTYGNSHYTYSGSMPNCDGMPRSAGTNLEAVMELYERTGNKGNMIHGEAPTRIFHADRGGSCYVSVEALDNESKWSAQQIYDVSQQNTRSGYGLFQSFSCPICRFAG